jgi:hypothetical protein
LISRCFDAVGQHGWAAWVGLEEDYGPGSAWRNPHNPGQLFVKATHLQPVQVDKHRFGTELPSLGDKTIDRQIPYAAKIRIGVGKCADSA